MCKVCVEAHLIQQTKFDHEVISLKDKQNIPEQYNIKNMSYKCPTHATSELNKFCTTCNQVICNDCSRLIHKEHKCQSISNALKDYLKLIKNNLEKIQPLSDNANHTISKLNEISKRINLKCDKINDEVELFLEEYYQSLNLHRKLLLGQIVWAKEHQLEIIKIQQNALEKRSTEAKSAIKFTEDLLCYGNETAIMSSVENLLKRFEHCQKSEKGFEINMIDSLRFLPEIRAPSMKLRKNTIPIFGIITHQTADPKFCTIESGQRKNWRVHKVVELVVVSKDNQNRALCYGGLKLTAELRYHGNDNISHFIHTQVTDKLNGTYLISFIPETTDQMTLEITVQGGHIKGSPFMVCARTSRSHTGYYTCVVNSHCCKFDSSGGLRTSTCRCYGKINPGQRHWSCCANILRNSDCSKVNVITSAV